jgi:hypothetical protein
MEIVDGIGAVGEIIGWIGLLVGIPLLLVGVLTRTAQGRHTLTKINVLEDLEDQPVALWSTGDRTYTRPLTTSEARHVAELGEPVAYVSDRNPESMRLEARSPFERACTTIALVMLGAAVLGFVASFLPLFWG